MVITVSAPISMPPVGDADQVGGDAIQLQHQHPNDVGLFWNLGFDVEQPLDAEAVGRLLIQRATR